MTTKPMTTERLAIDAPVPEGVLRVRSHRRRDGLVGLLIMYERPGEPAEPYAEIPLRWRELLPFLSLVTKALHDAVEAFGGSAE